MFLDVRIHTDYIKDILPFIENGIIIDTCVVKEIIDGVISLRISKKKSSELDKIESFFDLIKLNGKWNKFYVTPHILTEVCRHIRDKYYTWKDHKAIIDEIMPILKDMGDRPVSKKEFLGVIENNKNLAIEAGDISIFVTADDFMNKKERIAILSNDSGIHDKYKFHPHVMIMDYNSVIQNM